MNRYALRRGRRPTPTPTLPLQRRHPLAVVRLAALIFASALALLLAGPAPALAHGGGVLRITDQQAGPYRAFVWTNADPMRVGIVHVTVALMDPSNQRPVMDAEVQVRLEPVEGDPAAQPVAAPATHRNALIRTYYEADLRVAYPGRWRTSVAFDKEGQRGEVAFDVQIVPGSGSSWLWLGTAAVITVAAFWAMRPAEDSKRAARRARPRPQPQSRSRWQPTE